MSRGCPSEARCEAHLPPQREPRRIGESPPRRRAASRATPGRTPASSGPGVRTEADSSGGARRAPRTAAQPSTGSRRLHGSGNELGNVVAPQSANPPGRLPGGRGDRARVSPAGRWRRAGAWLRSHRRKIQARHALSARLWRGHRAAPGRSFWQRRCSRGSAGHSVACAARNSRASSRRSILPIADLGKAPRNSSCFGTLYAAR